jgi:hypothetical protein
VFVEPCEVYGELASHGFQRERNENPSRALVLHRTYESLDHGDAAVLLDGSEARPDAAPLAPVLEGVTPELRSLVRDHVLGHAPDLANRPIEHSLHFERRWSLHEDGEAHNGA